MYRDSTYLEKTRKFANKIIELAEETHMTAREFHDGVDMAREMAEKNSYIRRISRYNSSAM